MVLVATQVKRRRGTTAENDAFTGAEGEITVDTEKHELRVHDGVTQGGFKIGGGSGAMPVGAIFMTPRTGTIAGAVECNGGTYSTADYEGEGSIGELLAGGNLPYVSLAEYGTLLSTNGVVGVFGWDGTGTTTFRVPTLQDVFVECGQASQSGNYIPAGLPNLSGYTELWGAGFRNGSGVFSVTSGGTNNQVSQGGANSNNLNFNASGSNPIYGNSTTVQPKAIKYRAMVQLATGATDQALETCTSVLADVAGLKDMSNVTATGKETVVGWGMPDYSAGVTISANINFTCPANGVISGEVSAATNGYCSIRINDILVGQIGSESGQRCRGPFYVQVKKGDVVYLLTNGNAAVPLSNFYPYTGVN